VAITLVGGSSFLRDDRNAVPIRTDGHFFAVKLAIDKKIGETTINGGITTVSDVIGELPADACRTPPTTPTGILSARASVAALRSLTVNSTLVLIDGTRAADPATPIGSRENFGSRGCDGVSVANKQQFNFWQFLSNLLSLPPSSVSAALRQLERGVGDCGSKGPIGTLATEPRTMSSITNSRENTMRISRRVSGPGKPAPASEAVGMTRVLTVAGAVIGALMGTSAMGQQATASTAADTTELQEVVVTGSMIKRINAETAEAVTIVKVDTLKDLGVTSVEGALALITSNNQTITTGSNVATFNGGASVASLRGMGAHGHSSA
jgi:hypothetical protein